MKMLGKVPSFFFPPATLDTFQISFENNFVHSRLGKFGREQLFKIFGSALQMSASQVV